MSVSIRVASSPGEAQIAVVEGRRLRDYTLWRPGTPDGVGDVHRGRVIAHVPAMAGAFVALVDAEGFLPDSAGGRSSGARPSPGTSLTVCITRAAQGDKGPRLALIDEPSPGGPPALLRRGPDPISRLAARYPDAEVVVDDAALAADLRLSARISVQQPGCMIFDMEVAEAIDALSGSVVELPGGSRISIWPTPAVIAIDVDSAGALARSGAGSAGSRPRHEALNREILPMVADQIRLRNLSGGIVIDLAGLSPRRRAALAGDFSAALASDPLRPRFLGFTALGLAEVVRSRVHPPLHELLATPLAAGLAALRSVIRSYDGNPRSLPALRAHPAIVTALQADGAALSDLKRRTGRGITLRPDPALPAMVWMLEKDNG